MTQGVKKVQMLWPAELEARVREKVGARGMTAWVIQVIEQALGGEAKARVRKVDPNKPHAFAGAPAGRCETCGLPLKGHS